MYRGTTTTIWMTGVLLLSGAGCAGGAPGPAGDWPWQHLGATASIAPASRPAQELQAAWEVQGARPWRYIVIHHSSGEGGNAANFDAFHRSKGWDELGYHFVIDNGNGGPDGQVEIGSRWRSQKWGAHTGGTPDNAYNKFGIGICLVGNFNSKNPSPAQLAALEQLVNYLSRRYDIAAGDIIGHRDAPNARTECPGDVLHTYIYRQLRPQVARMLDGAFDQAGVAP